jgi:hypothetical protein
MKYTEADIANFAANVWPDLYKTRSAKAILKAIKLLEEVEGMASVEKKKVKTKPQAIDPGVRAWVRELERIRAPQKKTPPKTKDINLDQRVSYRSCVTALTGEKNWERALPKFKRFMAAKFPKDGEAEIRIGGHEKRGFTVNQIIKCAGHYQPWWRREKSDSARRSALAKKKKRGRVKRPKSDLRFTENRRHKKGYCQECGKRVRQHKGFSERLCNQCLSGKPQLITTKSAGPEEPVSIVATMRQDASRRRSGGLLKTEAMDKAYKDIYERLDGGA